MTTSMLDAVPTVESFSPVSARELNRRPISVSVQGLTKSFPVRRTFLEIVARPLSRPRTTIIHGLNLDIGEAEMFGILGLNGAGKTTLLKMLATIILPDAGTATVGGFDIVAQPREVRAMLAMVTADERSLNWRLSARENLRLFAGLHRMDPAESSRRTDEVLASVQLGGAGNKIVGAFSSGMRQRLLLARALLSRPRILLLDEPTRSLDPVTAHEFRRLLRDELVCQRGVTVILATHNPEEAFAYCDRVAVLHHGIVSALGSARALATRFGQERYRIWTPTAEHPCFALLVRAGHLTDLVCRTDADGSQVVECTISGGETHAPKVLKKLVEANVTISRFERAEFPLSSLIARIVESQEASSTPQRRSSNA
jgi:ABC-2 type transport system ATP-binding protein